jgi:hypothetical protein
LELSASFCCREVTSSTIFSQPSRYRLPARLPALTTFALNAATCAGVV